MGKAHRETCPHCNSEKVVQNGHPHRGKLQYFCHTCHKYFSEDTAKGYPPTNIPFPIIAYVLYFRKKVPEFSNMRVFRKFVSHWLGFLRIKDKEVSRQILHHWIKHYESNFESIISFHEAREYCKKLLAQEIKDIPKEVVARKTVPHIGALRVLRDKFGQQYCFDLIRKEEEFFDELCEITSKYEVYCWKHLDKEWLGRSKRLFSAKS